MSDQTSESSAKDILLTGLVDEFAARYRAGQRPPLQEYIDRYPELADDIRELFPAMVEIEQVREDHREADAPPAPALGRPLDRIVAELSIRVPGEGPCRRELDQFRCRGSHRDRLDCRFHAHQGREIRRATIRVSAG
jgi:hypothetical protein